MAQAFVFTPGPQDLFCRFRPSPGGQFGSPVYLGTCVVAPEPEEEQFKIPVMNDLGGRSVPFQLVQDGENASLTATLNRFDLDVSRLLRAQSSGLFSVNGIGNETGIARGTLVIGVSDFEFIIKNRYFNQPVAGGPVPAGRRYLSANCRKYKESAAGARVNEIAFALDFQNVYNVSTGAFSLYTEDLSGLNLIPN
jgi:hypothetical protein